MISMTATGPPAVTPGSVTLTGGRFAITVPPEWSQLLRAIGTTSVRGTARSDATALISG